MSDRTRRPGESRLHYCKRMLTLSHPDCRVEIVEEEAVAYDAQGRMVGWMGGTNEVPVAASIYWNNELGDLFR